MKCFARRARPGVGDLAASDRGGDRKAAAERLPEAYDIGLHLFAFASEHRAGASETGIDLVENEQGVMSSTERAQTGQETFGRDDDACATLDRLDDHRADVAILAQRFRDGVEGALGTLRFARIGEAHEARRLAQLLAPRVA